MNKKWFQYLYLPPIDLNMVLGFDFNIREYASPNDGSKVNQIKLFFVGANGTLLASYGYEVRTAKEWKSMITDAGSITVNFITLNRLVQLGPIEKVEKLHKWPLPTNTLQPLVLIQSMEEEIKVLYQILNLHIAGSAKYYIDTECIDASFTPKLEDIVTISSDGESKLLIKKVLQPVLSETIAYMSSDERYAELQTYKYSGEK